VVDVLVVGAGIVGLTCAVRLREAGARVAVVAADPPARTTSAVAAAVWYPTRIDADPRVLGWGTRTFDVLMEQVAAGVPGTARRPTRMVLRAEAADPWWAAAVPDLVTGPGEWRFTVPAVEMGPYLEWLAASVGPIERRRLGALAEVAGAAPVMVNATGLAAGRLAGDPAVHPVRGQVVLVANPGLDTSVRDEEHPDGPVYVHPRRTDVVLGGTFEVGATDLAPRPEVAEAIRRRCAAVVPETAGARVLGHKVGLRPARHGGPRVEVDPVGLPGGTRLVHAYGHGGAGVTLSWGGAEEVVRLALDP
jgi:D-amino-acid oxidase